MSRRVESITRYKLGVVSENEYNADPLCPACLDRNDTDNHSLITTIQTSKMLGDIMVCNECNDPYLVLEEPKLENETIFFLDTKLL